MKERLRQLIKNAKALCQTESDGAQDVVAMRARNIAIEALYLFDGRDNPKHPNHHHYTGLWDLEI